MKDKAVRSILLHEGIMRGSVDNPQQRGISKPIATKITHLELQVASLSDYSNQVSEDLKLMKEKFHNLEDRHFHLKRMHEDLVLKLGYHYDWSEPPRLVKNKP